MDDLYDLIIIGLGPASMTAAVYASRYNMKIMLIGGIPGGLMMESHMICNWPGEIAISGADLSQKMFSQLQAMKAEIVFDEVNAITGTKGNFTLSTRGGKSYQAKFVMIATGTEHRHLGIEGEAKYAGKGIAYCATCDAMFYKGKVTAVTGGGNSAITAALYLSELCPQVYLIYRGTELKGEVAWMKDLANKANVSLLPSTNVIGFGGDDKLDKILIDRDFNGSKELAVSGLFVEIGSAPRNQLFTALGGEVDNFGYIKVNVDMSTNVPGIYSAGDLTNGSNGFRQIATAVGEGAIAADSVFKALKS